MDRWIIACGSLGKDDVKMVRIILVLNAAWLLTVSAAVAGEYAIMKVDTDTLLEWQARYDQGPEVHYDEALDTPQGSFSILNHVNYIPVEYNQGNCGNCWQWAGTTTLAVALHVSHNVFERLSVQHVNSCVDSVLGINCCAGASVWDLADFYNSVGFLVPWSNINAQFEDADAACDVSCGSIGTFPHYPVLAMSAYRITTRGVGQTVAINNIKNVLHQNRAVVLGFGLPDTASWDNFKVTFWSNQPETTLWNSDSSCGSTYTTTGGWHAVTCVGYNDNNPSNRYWIMLNSWGTADGMRPNSLYRLDMDLNYDCQLWDPVNSVWVYNLSFEAMSVTFSSNYCPCP
ncbi:MAG: hypothetical protein D3926_14760 [Desulfobacteraceae bacterium]|nr:MAG: hypothetical protein D3926_14760 [Desulfobacteraceae bacterium]